jgi:hypothetical protein
MLTNARLWNARSSRGSHFDYRSVTFGAAQPYNYRETKRKLMAPKEKASATCASP